MEKQIAGWVPESMYILWSRIIRSFLLVKKSFGQIIRSHWSERNSGERCPQNPVVRVDPGRWDRQFVSDPCVLRDGKVWLDYYFGLEPGHAQEGLAISTDLIHWEKIDGPIVEHGPGESNDSIHAHKASIFYENGRLYHFYCGTRPWREGDPANNGGEFRTIMVASNHPFFGIKEGSADCEFQKL